MNFFFAGIQNEDTMATNHISVAMILVETTSFPRGQSVLFLNYIFPSHYDQVLFSSVYFMNIYNLRDEVIWIIAHQKNFALYSTLIVAGFIEIVKFKFSYN